MIGLEKEFPYCSNPDCELYVRAGEPGVYGSGNWAELPDGRIFGRSVYSGVYLCDPCGRQWLPVRILSAGTASRGSHLLPFQSRINSNLADYRATT